MQQKDAAAASRVLRVLEEAVATLTPDSEFRSVFDEWAQQLSTTPPGWVASTPRQLPSGG
jgi:hypothetical protein